MRPVNFTLVSDTNYVAQNGARVCRALFEVCSVAQVLDTIIVSFVLLIYFIFKDCP
jgi:hypothetical protein